MSRQTICDRCARVIEDSDNPWCNLQIERTEQWNDVSSKMNFCVECVTEVLYPEITEYMKQHDFDSKDAPAEVVEEGEGRVKVDGE